MKLQQGASLVEISKITVPTEARQRQVGRDVETKRLKSEDLEASIKRYGLLNPILVDENFVLRAGERRLTACRNLGMEKILVRKISSLTPAEEQIIELEENIKRLDLDWQDAVRGVARIHSLYRQIDPDWTMGETADVCALNLSTVSMYLKVHREMAESERVAKAGTVREAYNMIDRRDQRMAGEALQELMDGPDLAVEPPAGLSPADQAEAEALRELGQPLPPRLVERPRPTLVVSQPESILQASFLDWAPAYSGPKFNLVHCDFPYGIELFSGPQGRGAEPGAAREPGEKMFRKGEGFRVGYEDSATTYQALLRGLCANLDRIMSVSAHLMFWLSADFRIIHETIRMFNELAPSLKFTKFPLIWVKSDNAGIASDPKHGPRHVYEACLLASRGNRNIAKVKGDAYSAPTDKKLHPSTKPEPMLRHFMEMLVDETTTMLDPTCGSGASLRAAESLGAKHTLGLEIDPQYIGPARLALKQARALRAAERAAQ